MVYIAPADFHAATIAEYCVGIALETTDISDANLTTLIATQSALFDRYTGDHFAAEAAATLKVDGEDQPNLWVSKRIRAVTSIAVTYPGGVSITVPSSAYTFEVFDGDYDMLDHESYISLWSGLYLWPGGWPQGDSNVTIVGDFGWLTTPPEVKRAVALACWERVMVDGSTALAGPANENCFSRLVEAQSIADLFRRKGRG